MYNYAKIKDVNGHQIVSGGISSQDEIIDASLILFSGDFNALLAGVGKLEYINESFMPYVSPPREISKFAFRSRFTDAEKVGIYLAMETSTDSMVRAILKVFLDDLISADTINLDEARTTAGLDYLVSLGLLQQGRIAEMLA